MNPPSLRLALLGEFLGTALLIILGDGVVASVVLLGKQGDWILITTGWGLAVALGVYLSARMSGGHLNPAVSLALAARGDFPWSRLTPYILAQMVGAFVGAVIVYLDYGAAFADFEQKNQIVRGALSAGKLVGPAAGGAGVFATYPAYDDLWRNLFSEFLGTAILMAGIRALTDPRNTEPARGLQPILIGVVVWSIGLSLGGLTGYAINPARDLGPRLASSVLGWGSAVFQSHNNYFWVPIVGPMVGGLAGTYLYDFAIGRHLSPADEPSPPGRVSP
ncbi:MAG: MIP family channel protein [Isosphaeraceae bacterium]